nr:unnamed protein product [Digitaria exilis]
MGGRDSGRRAAVNRSSGGGIWPWLEIENGGGGGVENGGVHGRSRGRRRRDVFGVGRATPIRSNRSSGRRFIDGDFWGDWKQRHLLEWIGLRGCRRKKKKGGTGENPLALAAGFYFAPRFLLSD